MPETIALLVGLLIDELSAKQQYLAEEAYLRNRGYTRLADIIHSRYEQEHEHSEELLGRIYELGGTPDVSMVRNVNPGMTVRQILANDYVAEQNAINKYNAAIVAATTEVDFTTRSLLEHIVVEESEHLKRIREMVMQYDQLGEQNFLASLVGS